MHSVGLILEEAERCRAAQLEARDEMLDGFHSSSSGHGLNRGKAASGVREASTNPIDLLILITDLRC